MAVASSAALLALPWVATLGQPGLLVAVALLWASTSSILRAPAFSLLARAGAVSARPGLVSGALVGIGIGGAVGPLLTTALRGADPRLPLAVAAIALAAAALFAARIENGGQGVPPRPRAERGWVVPLAAAVFVAAFGMQLHTALASDGLYRRFPEVALDLLRPTFWLGFAAGLGIAAFLKSARRPLLAAGAASLVGALGLVVAHLAPSVAVLVVAQCVAGAAWAVVFSVAIATALARGGPTGAGTPVGLLFSALALAAVVRLGIVGLGLHTSAVIVWIPAITWIVAAALLATVPTVGAQHERASAPA